MSSVRVLYLRAALHPNVVGLWWDQSVQLRLVGALSSVHRGDSQQDGVIIPNQQLRAVPTSGNDFARFKGTLLPLQEPPALLLWFKVRLGISASG